MNPKDVTIHLIHQRSNMSTPSSAISGNTSSTLSSAIPTFSGVDTTILTPPGSDEDVVESPSVSSSNALARFEFEPGRSTDGTKVLMVEWEDDETTHNICGDWAITWESKRTVLAAKDVADGGINRLYFLLPAGERIPATVTLTLNGKDKQSKEQKEITWKTNPLPAIFPPQLGATAREAGKKGVLHTIWAKRRLQVLSREIDAESASNVEGVALQMAIQEREWIESNFGVTAKPSSIMMPSPPSSLAAPESHYSLSPVSPRSPGGSSRLMDKLKGLKLETRATTPPDAIANPLSPEQTDVAVSSFGSFAAIKGAHEQLPSLAAKPFQRPTPTIHTPIPGKSPHSPVLRKVAVQRPPHSIIAQQQQSIGIGMGSLNALGSSDESPSSAQAEKEKDSPAGYAGDDEREDDLFALPMSPRSPDMGVSPFSFGTKDALRGIGGVQSI